MPDALTSALDQIRERYRTSFTTLPGFSTTLTGAEWTHVNSADDIPFLLAAVEAVLKLADEWQNSPWPDDGGDRAGVATEQVRLDGAALREAITAALTKGEDGNHGHP